MHVESDARLWSDDLWAALQRAKSAVECQPAILREKKPEWDSGLNATVINALIREHRLSKHPIFEVREEEEEGSRRRLLVVHHPGPPDPLEIETWPCFARRIGEGEMRTLLAYLDAWLNARARQLKRQKRVKPGGREPVIKLPGDAQWSDLWIRLMEEDTVDVSIKGVHNKLTASEMRLTKSRTGRPLKQWELLTFFAQLEGVFEWGSLPNRKLWEKQKQELSKSLRDAFGIAGDPINTKKGAWLCQFRISDSRR